MNQKTSLEFKSTNNVSIIPSEMIHNLDDLPSFLEKPKITSIIEITNSKIVYINKMAGDCFKKRGMPLHKMVFSSKKRKSNILSVNNIKFLHLESS